MHCTCVYVLLMAGLRSSHAWLLWHGHAYGVTTSLDAGESSSSSSTSAGVQDGFTWHQPSSRNRRQQQQQQMQSVIRSPAGVFRRVSSQVYCSGDAASKQTCLFSNVCLVPTTNTNSSLPAQLTVVLSTPDDSRDGNRGAAVNRTVRLLKQHLGAILGGQHTYHGLTFITAAGELESSRTLSGDSSTAEQAIVRDLLLGDIASGSTSSVQVDEGVTILWRPVPHQQQSFGHALLNEAFPMFLVLSNHFGVGPADLPRQLQLLVSADNWRSPVLSHVLSDVITPNMMLLKDRLAQMHKQGKAGVCFRWGATANLLAASQRLQLCWYTMCVSLRHGVCVVFC